MNFILTLTIVLQIGLVDPAQSVPFQGEDQDWSCPFQLRFHSGTGSADLFSSCSAVPLENLPEGLAQSAVRAWQVSSQEISFIPVPLGMTLLRERSEARIIPSTLQEQTEGFYLSGEENNGWKIFVAYRQGYLSISLHQPISNGVYSLTTTIPGESILIFADPTRDQDSE